MSVSAPLHAVSNLGIDKGHYSWRESDQWLRYPKVSVWRQ